MRVFPKGLLWVLTAVIGGAVGAGIVMLRSEIEDQLVVCRRGTRGPGGTRGSWLVPTTKETI